MNWKRWRIGAGVALFLALLVAGAGDFTSWTSFIKTYCAAAGAIFGSFLKDHPIDSIQDTTFLTRSATETTPTPNKDNK